jgi:tRNA A37 threonylcarbamoyladenosine modification protein TsaB
MPLFALETSTERLSLAIIDGEGSFVFAREIDAGQRHSELAIAAIADLGRGQVRLWVCALRADWRRAWHWVQARN